MEKPVHIAAVHLKKFGWHSRTDRLNWNNDKYAIILYENWTRKFIADYEELIMELSIKIHPLDYLVSLIK